MYMFAVHCNKPWIGLTRFLTRIKNRHVNGICISMLLALSYKNQLGFDELLLMVLAFNMLILLVLTYAPQLHNKLTNWILPRRQR
jgi:hypothetical protein